jgi:hypothetical protein
MSQDSDNKVSDVQYGDMPTDTALNANEIPKFDKNSDSWVTQNGSSFKCMTISSGAYNIAMES